MKKFRKNRPKTPGQEVINKTVKRNSNPGRSPGDRDWTPGGSSLLGGRTSVGEGEGLTWKVFGMNTDYSKSDSQPICPQLLFEDVAQIEL